MSISTNSFGADGIGAGEEEQPVSIYFKIPTCVNRVTVMTIPWGRTPVCAESTPEWWAE